MVYTHTYTHAYTDTIQQYAHTCICVHTQIKYENYYFKTSKKLILIMGYMFIFFRSKTKQILIKFKEIKHPLYLMVVIN